MHKMLFTLLIAALLLVGCAAPSPSAPTGSAPVTELEALPASEVPAALGSLLIEGVTGITAITLTELQSLPEVTVEATVTNKNGESTTSRYTGVRLSAVLEKLGVTEFTAIRMVADDGFEASYDPAMAKADSTLIAWAIDGAPIEKGGPLRAVPEGGTGNQFVKSLTTIAVEP